MTDLTTASRRRGTFRIATAPLWVVTFADILLADVYTSFAKVRKARIRARVRSGFRTHMAS